MSRLSRIIRNNIGGHLATAKLPGNATIEPRCLDAAIGRLHPLLPLHAPNGTIDAFRRDPRWHRPLGAR